jgi:hypothetical protein
MDEQLCVGYLAHARMIGITWIVIGLIVGVIAVGGALCSHMIELPPVALRFGPVSLVGYRTHTPECPPRAACAPPAVADPQSFYVVWSIYEPATAAQPYGKTATRMVIIPLAH